VLRELEDENIQLPEALNVIQETLKMIREIESFLPASSTISFRERLITYKESLEKLDKQKYSSIEKEFLFKAGELLNIYENRFGVDDFIDYDE